VRHEALAVGMEVRTCIESSCRRRGLGAGGSPAGATTGVGGKQPRQRRDGLVLSDDVSAASDGQEVHARNRCQHLS